MGNCWKHGDYEGWSCKTCAIEEATEASKAATEAAGKLAEETRQVAERYAREATEAAQEAADEVQEALWESQRQTEESIEESISEGLRKQKKLAAKTWRLQAQDKVDRAWELLRSEMYKDAADLAAKAVSGDGDPGNIEGYLVLARALPRLNRMADAIVAWEKAVKLLGSPGYDECVCYSMTLAAMPTPPGKLQAFKMFAGKVEALAKAEPSELDPDFLILLAKYDVPTLCERVAQAIPREKVPAETLRDMLAAGHLRIAKLLVKRCCGHADTLDPIRAILKLGHNKIAAILTERYAVAQAKLPNLRVWIEATALLYEIKNRHRVGDPSVALKAAGNWNHTTAGELLTALSSFQEAKSVSPKAAERVTSAVLELYSDWEPDIIRAMERKADEESERAGKLGCGTMVLLWFLLVYLSGHLIDPMIQRAHPSERHGWAAVCTFATVVLAVGIVPLANLWLRQMKRVESLSILRENEDQRLLASGLRSGKIRGALSEDSEWQDGKQDEL